MVDLAKITVILNLEASQGVKQLHATLGHMGYYRKFIKSYTQIITLTRIYRKRMSRFAGMMTA